ncbi:reverse transcriptase domain-containing protein [Tanacetum coccineum]
MTLVGPSVPPPNPSSSKEVERDPKTITNQVHISSPENTARIPPLVVQPSPSSKTNKIPERNPHQPHIPYPLRLNKEKLQDKSDIQIHKFLQMFKLHFNISFAEALAQMPNPLNENCSVVLLRKLPEKLADPGKFLIPCDFSELEECMALADQELANRSVAYPAGIAEDVFVQVGKFTFPTDFIFVDYDVDPRVPLTLGRPFLRTACALVDHGDESINKIDILNITCEDYFHEVLNVQQSIHPLSGSPTPFSELVVASLSPSLTPFGDSDFLLEETDAFLSLDDLIPPVLKMASMIQREIFFFLEELLNDDPTNDLPPPKELKK